jgi:hypothetical protein
MIARVFSHRSSQSCDDAGAISTGFGFGFGFLAASVLGGVVDRSGGSSENGFVLRVLDGNRSELTLLGRRLILGHRDIAFDCHAVLVVSGLGLTSYAIKLELLMKSRIAGHILPVGAQKNCLFGAVRQREYPKQ